MCHHNTSLWPPKASLSTQQFTLTTHFASPTHLPFHLPSPISHLPPPIPPRLLLLQHQDPSFPFFPYSTTTPQCRTVVNAKSQANPSPSCRPAGAARTHRFWPATLVSSTTAAPRAARGTAATTGQRACGSKTARLSTALREWLRCCTTSIAS